MTEQTLFIIPARGGSKGIPGKNIKPLGGRPLICYAIDNARAIAADEDICVSTDSTAIMEVAQGMGLGVPFLRPSELATDTAGSREVMLHALDFYSRERMKDYSRIVLLQPTSPFTLPEDIRRALSMWRDGIDMVVSVKEAATNPYYNAYETDSNGMLRISKGEGCYTRRQDAPEVWEFNGAVYVISADSLRRMPMGQFTRRVPMTMPRERSVDLDTPLDWMVAESLVHTIRGGHR